MVQNVLGLGTSNKLCYSFYISFIYLYIMGLFKKNTNSSHGAGINHELFTLDKGPLKNMMGPKICESDCMIYCFLQCIVCSELKADHLLYQIEVLKQSQQVFKIKCMPYIQNKCCVLVLKYFVWFVSAILFINSISHQQN